MESTEGHHEAAAEIAPSPPLPTSASRTNARPKREIPVAAPRVEEENGGREVIALLYLVKDTITSVITRDHNLGWYHVCEWAPKNSLTMFFYYLWFYNGI